MKLAEKIFLKMQENEAR
jgi:hypothetical protein